MDTGYIKLYRQIRDNWVWQDPEALRAWLDLLLSASHKDHKVMTGNELIILKRGTLLTSIRELSKRWGWGRTRTSNFLSRLTDEGMISQKRATERATAQTLIFITHFDLFQTPNKPQNVPQTSHTRATDEPQQKNGKNGKECKSNTARTRNAFHNFNQRDTDLDALLLAAEKGGDDDGETAFL